MSYFICDGKETYLMEYYGVPSFIKKYGVPFFFLNET